MDYSATQKKQLDPQRQGLLSDLVKTVPKVVFVYLNQGRKEKNPFLSRWNIMVDVTKSELTNKILPIVQGLFFDIQDESFSLFSLEYAKGEMTKGNLYFLNYCRLEQLVFRGRDVGHPWNYNPFTSKESFLIDIEEWFRSSMEGAITFKKGFIYFKAEGNLSQAAFMAHQGFELGYRVLEGFLSGKVKICHKIAAHQKFIEKTVNKIPGMFDIEDDTESSLLDLLDRAYSSSRYDNSYRIEMTELDALEHKLVCFLGEIRRFFKEEFELLQKRIAATQKTCTEKHYPEELKLFDSIRKLGEDNFEMMRPICGRTNKGYYLNHVYIHSHFSLFCTLRSTLNVCILALDGQSDMTLNIKNIKEDVKTVLEFSKNLIPIEEGNYLDEMRKLMFSDKGIITK